MKIRNDVMNQELDKLVLFSFDKQAFPFQNGVRLKLHSFPRELDELIRPVVGIGKPGTPDSGTIAYYGTVCKVGAKYYMWYLANDDQEGWYQRLALAVSEDGFQWEKPNLGLVEYNGNKDNNLCDFPLEDHLQSCAILYDEEEEDPEKRFKMNFESIKYDKKMCVAFSPDGLHWKEYEKNPVGRRFFEQSGIMKLNSMYYVTGQGSTGHYSPKGSRTLVTYCSADFIHWTESCCQGFSRESMPPRPTFYGGVNGSQVHLGAGLWNRGNIILGFYGMWEGHSSNDRNMTYMHIGLITSHDGLHYEEPIPDFPLVLAGEMKNNTHAAGHFPALMQGQGVENIADKTVFWYGLWPESDSDGVRAAVWTRDRFGHLEPFTGPESDSSIISDVITGNKKPVRIWLNIDGLGQYTQVKVSLLREDFSEIEGYGICECNDIEDNGIRVPVSFRHNLTVGLPVSFRIKVEFQGIRPEEAKLYAIYVEQ